MEKRARKFSLRTLLLVVALAGPCIALPFSCYRGTITVAQSHRIQIGMTQAEVIEICGQPVSEETRPDGSVIWMYYLDKFVPTAFVTPLCVEFDSAGKVRGTSIL